MSHGWTARWYGSILKMTSLILSQKTFRYADIDDYYKTVNIYKFSKEFLRNSYVPFLEAYSKALGNNEYYEQVLRVITLLERCELKGLPLEGERWYEIDDIQDLDIAETIFAEQDQLQRYQKIWRILAFPKAERFLLFSKPLFSTTKMCEELQANFNVLLREYPSGMGVNTLVMAKTSVSGKIMWLLATEPPKSSKR